MQITYADNNVYITDAHFGLEQTLDCGQAFRFAKTPDGLWRGVVGRRELTLEQRGQTVILCHMPRDLFKSVYYRYFALDMDYDQILAVFSADETLKQAIGMADGLRVLRQDKWETICSFILSQNNNIPRIKGIIARLCACFGDRIGKDAYTFPTAQTLAALTVEDLAPIRAGFRAKYVIDAAQKVAGGIIDLSALETLPIDRAREMLYQIKGVGPKVAECILLFSCSRFEAFPLDVWIKRVMAALYPDGLPVCTTGMEGIAQQYLFYYARNIRLKSQI